MSIFLPSFPLDFHETTASARKMREFDPTLDDELNSELTANEFMLSLQDELLEEGEIPLEALQGNLDTQSPQSKSVFDWRASDREFWTDCLGSDIPQAVYLALQQTVLLPRFGEQHKLACSYLALPSRFCHRAPILFSQGKPGSGKSQLAKLVSAMFGIPTVGADSTYAGLKNMILHLRWRHPAGGFVSVNEQDFFLLWEDLSPGNFTSEDGHKILTAIKNGCDYTAFTVQAGKDGQVIKFPIFAPKIVSSITPIWAIKGMSELVRRVLVIEHKPFSEWEDSDFCQAQNLSPGDLLEIEEIDFSGFRSERERFWDSMHGEFTKHVSNLKKIKTSLDRPNKLMMLGVLATGLCCGYYSTSREAMDDLERFYEWHTERTANSGSPVRQLLKSFLDTIEPSFGGNEIRINPVIIRTHLFDKEKSAEVDVKITSNVIASEMQSLGYEMKLINGSMYWVK